VCTYLLVQYYFIITISYIPSVLPSTCLLFFAHCSALWSVVCLSSISPSVCVLSCPQFVFRLAVLPSRTSRRQPHYIGCFVILVVGVPSLLLLHAYCLPRADSPYSGDVPIRLCRFHMITSYDTAQNTCNYIRFVRTTFAPSL